MTTTPINADTCWCGGPVGPREPGDDAGLGCQANIAHYWQGLPNPPIVGGEAGHWYEPVIPAETDNWPAPVPHPGKVEDCVTCNPTPVVNYEPDSRLAQLHAVYFERKAAKDSAEADLKAVVDVLKTALSEAAPDRPKVRLEGPAGRALIMTYVESWRVQTAKLKKEYPQVYAICAQQSGSWRLEAEKGGA